MLEKQMRLLSEHSQKGTIELVPASRAICEVVYHWVRYFTEEGQRAFTYYSGEAPATPDSVNDLTSYLTPRRDKRTARTRTVGTDAKDITNAVGTITEAFQKAIDDTEQGEQTAW